MVKSTCIPITVHVPPAAISRRPTAVLALVGNRLCDDCDRLNKQAVRSPESSSIANRCSVRQISYGVPSFGVQLQLHRRVVRRFIRRGSSDGHSTGQAARHDVFCVGSSARAESVHWCATSLRFVAEPPGRLSRRHAHRKVGACDGRSSGLGEGTWSVA